MPQLDPQHFPSQLFWLCIVFSLLYLCVHVWIVPRIKKGMYQRHHYIDHKLREIASFQQSIENLEKKREAMIQLKSEEMVRALEDLRASHKALLTREQEKLKKNFQESQEKFKAQIHEEAEKIAKELTSQKSELVALTISELSSMDASNIKKGYK